ncbi:MAG: DUF5634 family protein [Desulfuromonadales bacterium]|nr:DUF5634 family protein [Desulfuromonadales bacterium]
MSDMGNYASYFSTGMKIGVGIPMPNSEVFLDWAVIYEVDEDLVTLQLSRDHLPVGVSLHVGQIVDLRGGRDDAAYSCRAIIVIEGRASFVLVRLIGEIVTDELREFYRVDAFLPIKYFLSREQNPDVLNKEWQTRRQKRLDEELLRKQQLWDVTFIAENADLPPERRQKPLADETEELDTSWDTIIPLAASISGGGIRIVAHQHFEEEEYVPLEIMVPSTPRRIVEAIGRVVFVNRNLAVAGDRESYNVALKFVFIDERDRDAIVNHIANIQLKRIRQLREHFALREGIDNPNDRGGNVKTHWETIVDNLMFLTILSVIIVMLFIYFRGYVTNHPKGEIEETFENGIRTFIQKKAR